MPKLLYSGVQDRENPEKLEIMVDPQNDWMEIVHTAKVTQVMNNTSRCYIIVKRHTLTFEVIPD